MSLKIKKPTFKKTFAFLENRKKFNPRSVLEKVGAAGAKALSQATPVDSGATAQSWGYIITGGGDKYKISWTNGEKAGSVPLAILLQYGHGTKGGTFVQGINFINPALAPIYDQLKEMILKEVTS